MLNAKNANSAYYKAIRISYPNLQDTAAAKARGVEPGGLVMVHGQRNAFGWLSPIAQSFNWTDGCVAVNNKDMDTIWKAVDVGTPIEILP